MDLLIELVVWIFNALFGSQEKQAKLGPRSRTDDESEGDTSDDSPRAQRPRTLAELLEEARREAPENQGRPAVPPPTPPRRPPPPPPPPPPRQVAPPVRQVKPLNTQPMVPVPSQVASVAPVLAPSVPQLAPIASLQARQDTAADAAPKKRRKDAQGRSARPGQVAANVAAERTRTSIMQRIGPATTMVPVLAHLRSQNNDERRKAAVQALVSYEIFAAPRCRRPFRPGPIQPI